MLPPVMLKLICGVDIEIGWQSNGGGGGGAGGATGPGAGVGGGVGGWLAPHPASTRAWARAAADRIFHPIPFEFLIRFRFSRLRALISLLHSFSLNSSDFFSSGIIRREAADFRLQPCFLREAAFTDSRSQRKVEQVQCQRLFRNLTVTAEWRK